MARFIVKLEERYLEWSTVTDSPVTWGMTLDEFESYYRFSYGSKAGIDLAERMARVELKGTSSHDDDSADSTIWLNRAGPGEIRLSKAEIIEWYVRRKCRPTAEEIAARRATFPKCDPCIAGPDEDGCGRMCRCWGSGVVDA